MPESARSRRFARIAALVCLLFALRLPFLAASVDDLDSANFLYGVRDYSPPAHRPHPPGYPVFIAAAKSVTAVTGSPLYGLTLVSAIAGSLACVPIFLVARRLIGGGAVQAATLACFTPAAWFASVRPMSDAFGWCVGLTALAALLAGYDRRLPSAERWWAIGSLACGLAIGVRLQLSVLVLPFFLVGWIRHRRLPLAGPALLAVAALSWWLPMIWLSGGTAAYLTAFQKTMAEAARWEPLFASPSLPKALDRLHDVLIAPWHDTRIAIPVLASAAVGAVTAFQSRRRSLGLLLLMFGPYIAFNYLVQHTAAVRYAIPGIPLVAALAARGLHRLPRPAILSTAFLLAYIVMAGTVTLPALSAYHAQESPPVRAMRDLAPGPYDRPIVSGTSVFSRYVEFAAPASRVISPADGNGWTRVTEYWRNGGDDPVYFLVMPGETVRSLLPPDAYTEGGRWDWPEPVRPFMTGERPNAVRSVRIAPPEWFLAANRTPRGRSTGLRLFVRTDEGRRDVLIQGRATSRLASQFSLRINGQTRDRQDDVRSFVLRTSVEPSPRFTEIQVSGATPFEITRVVSVRPIEARLQPVQGFRRAAGTDGEFHWLGPRATALAHVPEHGASLHLSGDLPHESSAAAAALVVRWNDKMVARADLSSPSFAVSVPLRPAQVAWSDLVIETYAGDAPAAFDLRLASISLDAGPETRLE